MTITVKRSHFDKKEWDVLTSSNGYQSWSVGVAFSSEASARRVAEAIQREVPGSTIKVEVRS